MIVSDSMIPTITPLEARSTKIDVPEVHYSALADQQIRAAIRLADTEVGWLGLVQETSYGFLITEIFIPRQTVTRVTTDIDEDAVAELAMRLLDEGKDPSKLRYWGHSHVNMDVAPSMADEMQIEEYLDNDSCDWFIRGIHNKRGACKMDVYDKRAGVIYQCVPTRIALNASIVERVLKDLEKNVTEQELYNGRRYRSGERDDAAVAGKPNIIPHGKKRAAKRQTR